MRTIQASEISKTVAELCKKACYVVTPDMRKAFEKAKETEVSSIGKEILGKLLQNADLAEKGVAPICQDTGMTVVFVELGQDVHIEGGYIEDAINEGVKNGYVDNYLRKSVVAEPLFERKNTTNNTPAVINMRIVPGEKLKITVAPKGFGSENKSVLKMLVPADGVEGVKKVFLEAVKYAGPNSCPPMVLGVGIGGTMDKAALLAKQAAVRSVDSRNPDERYAKLEDELLELARQTGVGPQGLGGLNTAVKVNVEWYPTHIAGLPVAINVNCHAARHASAEL
ncbi:fumarate hydratase [Campylobacter sp. JMF_01 NE2]|uniref:fumarate hydratase n=1 Tax=unclassified Campylobacter TaxID=2593542 RepID=UPI0022E9FEC6|nr:MULTISPECIES: fumarate hydratase [unclassified Campylobacter]MDA3045026.1 fumarate hydratase [Campylobacter sp. JMF_07 ED4]MDA3052406.1 fumarate hydratase [Campylobacter sp. JMF_03 NE3]MDA3054712.1 fumarate hydratase [Campylobacter sp. VBCF_07 NA4]MDA3061254.1 fumarate hydratase [Campylobacter sp. VBCF_02 NA5]MDA3064374.1 fumarate hydratase [Campylobacter sp. JMF_11 EL3]